MGNSYKDPLSLEDMPEETSSSLKSKLKKFKADATSKKSIEETKKFAKTMAKGAVSGATFGVYNPGSKAERESDAYKLGSNFGMTAVPVGTIAKGGKYVKEGINFARGLNKTKQAAVAASEAKKAAELDAIAARLRRQRVNPGKVDIDYNKLKRTESLAQARAKKTPIRGEKVWSTIEGGIDKATETAGLGRGPVARAQGSAALGAAGYSTKYQAEKIYDDYKKTKSKPKPPAKNTKSKQIPRTYLKKGV